jgi:WD40 repeat protein
MKAPSDLIGDVALRSGSQAQLLRSSCIVAIMLFSGLSCSKEAKGPDPMSVPINSVAFSSDGSVIAIGAGPIEDIYGGLGVAWTWDVEKASITHTCSSLFKTRVYALAVSPSDKTIATASATITPQRGAPVIAGDLILWNDDFTGPRRLVGHKHKVRAVCFSPDGSQLASGDNDGMVIIWDPKRGEKLFTLPKHQGIVWSIAYSPTGGLLATTDPGENSVYLWNCKTRARTAMVKDQVDLFIPTSVIFLDENTVALGCWDGSVQIWDIRTCRRTRVLMAHKKNVTCLAVSPDRHLLASGSVDCAIRLWDSRTSEPRGTLLGNTTGISAVAFSPNGKWIVGGGGKDETPGDLRIWDVATGKQIKRICSPSAK